MHSIYTTSAALLACLSSIAQAQSVYQGNACAIAPEVPAPANTVCNVVGKVGPQAQDHLIKSELSGRTAVCAQYCVGNPDCVFAVQEKGNSVCSLYNAGAAALGFVADPSANSIGFARKCYFRPSSCTFKLQCPANDPNCGGQFLATTSNIDDSARFPTAFVPNKAAGTTFTISNKRADITIAQNGKKYLGTVPSAATYKEPSAVSFFAQLGVGSSDAAPLTCIQNRDQIFNEPATMGVYCETPEPSGYMKSSFFSCPDTKRGRKTLRLARDPYYNGKDGCFDTKVSFGLVDFVATR